MIIISQVINLRPSQSVGELGLDLRFLGAQPWLSEISGANPEYRSLKDDSLLLDLLLFCSIFHIFFICKAIRVLISLPHIILKNVIVEDVCAEMLNKK